MAFECPHCGFRNNEVQSASEISETGVHAVCQIKNSKVNTIIIAKKNITYKKKKQ